MTLDEAIAADALGAATLTTSCGCRLVVSQQHAEADGHYILSILSCTGGVWGPTSVDGAALDKLLLGEGEEWRPTQAVLGPVHGMRAQVMAREMTELIEHSVLDALISARKGTDD